MSLTTIIGIDIAEEKLADAAGARRAAQLGSTLALRPRGLCKCAVLLRFSLVIGTIEARGCTISCDETSSHRTVVQGVCPAASEHLTSEAYNFKV